jgi:hypothetical protein
MQPPEQQPILSTGSAWPAHGHLPDGPRFRHSPQVWSFISKYVVRMRVTGRRPVPPQAAAHRSRREMGADA